MARYEIPLTAEPQKFNIQLSGKMYSIRMFWDWYAENWVFSISDVSGNMILSSVPLVAGVNLLEQYDHLELNGELWAYLDTDEDIPPNFKNIGANAKVYWVATDGN